MTFVGRVVLFTAGATARFQFSTRERLGKGQRRERLLTATAEGRSSMSLNGYLCCRIGIFYHQKSPRNAVCWPVCYDLQ